MNGACFAPTEARNGKPRAQHRVASNLPIRRSEPCMLIMRFEAVGSSCHAFLGLDRVVGGVWRQALFLFPSLWFAPSLRLTRTPEAGLHGLRTASWILFLLEQLGEQNVVTSRRSWMTMTWRESTRQAGPPSFMGFDEAELVFGCLCSRGENHKVHLRVVLLAELVLNGSGPTPLRPGPDWIPSVLNVGNPWSA